MFTVDLLLVVAGTVLALLLRENLELSIDKIHAFAPYLAATLLTAAFVVPAFGLSRSVWRFSAMPDYLHLVAASLAITVGAVTMSFGFNRLDGVARSIPFLQPVMMLLLLAGARVFMRIRHTNRGRPARQFDTAHGAAGPDRPTVLVVGLNRLAELYLQSVQDLSPGEIGIAGLVGHGDRHKGRLMHRYPVLGAPEQIATILNDLRVHGIFVERIVVTVKIASLSPEARAAFDEVATGSDVIVDFLAANLGLERGETSAPGPQAETSDGAGSGSTSPAALLSIGEEERSQLERRAYWGVKRGIDIVGALLLLSLLFPVMMLLALVVLANVGRPVLFWQQRPGLGRRPFRLYKFRTMGTAYDAGGRHIPDNLRLSACGRLLRRSRLDELPQLFNILVGQMSFIGPRPLLPVDQPVGSLARLQVRPGLTGWAQVKGGRHLSALDKVALDVWYVRNASLAVDLEIALRTFTMVIFGEQEHPEAVRRAWDDVRQAHDQAVHATSSCVPGSGNQVAA